MVELGSSHSFKVKLATDRETHEIELLTEKHLSRFPVKPNDIKNVSANFAVPGDLYEEPGVARLAHPCAGSACAVFQDTYGNQYSIDYIVYYDSNPRQSHEGGLPHWNTELRYMKNGAKIGKIEKEGIPHMLEDTSEIEIISNCDGSINKQKVLRDQPIKKQP